jgi:hypothetical protein
MCSVKPCARTTRSSAARQRRSGAGSRGRAASAQTRCSQAERCAHARTPVGTSRRTSDIGGNAEPAGGGARQAVVAALLLRHGARRPLAWDGVPPCREPPRRGHPRGASVLSPLSSPGGAVGGGWAASGAPQTRGHGARVHAHAALPALSPRLHSARTAQCPALLPPLPFPHLLCVGLRRTPDGERSVVPYDQD